MTAIWSLDASTYFELVDAVNDKTPMASERLRNGDVAHRIDCTVCNHVFTPCWNGPKTGYGTVCRTCLRARVKERKRAWERERRRR